MKKKLLISLCVVLLVFACGCTKTTEKEVKKDEKKTKEVSKLEIDGEELDLDATGLFNGLTYKYPKDIMTSNYGTYSIMDYMKDEKLLLRISMYYYEGKKVKEVMNDSDLSEIDELTYADKKWKFYTGAEDGKIINAYTIQDENNTYLIKFMASKDVYEFSNEFMTKLKFNK